jgi:hypothetical protein
MEEMGIIHSEISPLTLYYTDTGIRIGDFRQLRTRNKLLVTSLFKDRISVFCSPGKLDSVVRDIQYVREDNLKATVWSIGAVALCLGLLNYPVEINKQERESLVEQTINKLTDYSDVLRYILYWMLQIDEERRITIQELYEILETMDIPTVEDAEKLPKSDVLAYEAEFPPHLIVECVRLSNTPRPSSEAYNVDPIENDYPLLPAFIYHTYDRVELAIKDLASDLPASLYQLPIPPDHHIDNWVFITPESLLLTG